MSFQLQCCRTAMTSPVLHIPRKLIQGLLSTLINKSGRKHQQLNHLLHRRLRDNWSLEALRMYLEHLSCQTCHWEPQQAIYTAWAHETTNDQEEEEEPAGKELHHDHACSETPENYKSPPPVVNPPPAAPPVTRVPSMCARRRLRSKQPPRFHLRRTRTLITQMQVNRQECGLKPYNRRRLQEEVRHLLTLDEEDLLNHQDYQSVKYLSHVTLEGLARASNCMKIFWSFQVQLHSLSLWEVVHHSVRHRCMTESSWSYNGTDLHPDGVTPMEGRESESYGFRALPIFSSNKTSAPSSGS